jgi:ParB/RepB/Spo0J family partition protein
MGGAGGSASPAAGHSGGGAAGAASGRLSEQLWSRLFADPTGVRAFPEARRIPLRLIDTNPDQPRTQLTGIEELAAHIKEYGLLQPVVVTGPADGRYTLIAGGRRFAAYQWLASHETGPGAERWQDIPAVVRRLDTAERLVLAVAENVSRHDLSDAEVLTSVRLLQDMHQWSQAEIARRMGVSRQWINQYSTASADPELAELVQTGQLSAAKAYEVQRAHTPDLRAAALEAAVGGAPLRAIRQAAAGQMGGQAAEEVTPVVRLGPQVGRSGESDGVVASRDGTERAAVGVAQPAAPAGPFSDADWTEEAVEAGGGATTRARRNAAAELAARAAVLAARAEAAADVELLRFKTTALIRECLQRGIRRVRVARLLGALQEDLAQIEAALRE